MPDDDKSKKVIFKFMKNNMKNKFAKRYKGYSSEFDTWINEGWGTSAFDESAGLQLKMAFDDAGIKIKGVKGGKLVIDKKDKKKAEDVISKQMKNPADAKRVLGSQITFEDIEKPMSKLFSQVRKLMAK